MKKARENCPWPRYYHHYHHHCLWSLIAWFSAALGSLGKIKCKFLGPRSGTLSMRLSKLCFQFVFLQMSLMHVKEPMLYSYFIPYSKRIWYFICPQWHSIVFIHFKGIYYLLCSSPSEMPCRAYTVSTLFSVWLAPPGIVHCTAQSIKPQAITSSQLCIRLILWRKSQTILLYS